MQSSTKTVFPRSGLLEPLPALESDGSLIVPVLDQEPAVWPDALFSSDVESRVSERWQAYHVRPRTEKAVARELRQHDIAYFLPQIEHRKRYQRRLVCSHLVVFPGYVFALGQNLEWRIRSKAIIRSLIIDDQQQIERELRDIHRMIQSGLPMTREERLQAGSLVRITRGPLAGLRGQVVQNKHGQSFVLQVHFLQQGVSVAIDGAAIEAI